RQRHREPLAFRDRLQPARSSLLSRPFWSKPSRSLSRLRQFLDRGPHHHERTVRARDRAADQNHFFGLAHLHHLQVLHSYALITEMPRHSHILPNTARSGTIADGTIAAMRLRTVRRALPIEVVLLHHALEAFAFGATNHVDKI